MGKKRIIKSQRGFGEPKNTIKRDLAVINKYLAQDRPDKALEKFKTLDLVPPFNKEIMELGVALAHEANDLSYIIEIGLKWQEAAPNNPEPYQILGDAYLRKGLPFLCLKTCQQFLEKFPNHEAAKDIQELAEEMTPITEGFLKDINFSAEDIPLTWLHEMGQILMQQGKYEEAIDTLQELIDKAPNFIAPYNNLSVIYSQQEQWELAIETTKIALEKQPDNLHALSNAAQFSLLTGNEDLARSYAEKLRDIPNKSLEEVYLKKAETFSLLRDDQTLIELGEEAREDSKVDCDPLFWHWVAVAYANQDNWQKARKIWQDLPLNPQEGHLISENLKNSQLPLGQRNSPWAFDVTKWIGTETKNELEKLAEIMAVSNKKSAVTAFMERNARVISLIPLMLDRGCPTTKKFVFYTAATAEDATLYEMLKAFALGQRGSDQERVEVRGILGKAGFMPSGQVKMWIGGEWREILSMNWEINDEPTVKHSRKVLPMVQKIIRLIKTGEGEEAEKIIRKALELEPNAPDLWFNLAGAYQVQGREQEARDLVEKVHQDYPDYSFATLLVARHCIEEDDLDRAENLLKTFYDEPKLNYQAFEQLCQGNIELALARKQYDGAKSWLGMWEQIDPESDQLFYWQQKVKKKTDWF